MLRAVLYINVGIYALIAIFLCISSCGNGNKKNFGLLSGIMI